MVDNGTLVFNRSDDVTQNVTVISGSGNVVKSGSNTLTLTANQTYTGTTTIAGGTLVLQNAAPTTGSSSFNGPGALTVQPASTSFTSAFSTTGWTFGSTLGGLTIGKSGNTADVTLATAANIAGPITVYGGNIAVNAGLTASGTNTIAIISSGNVTEGVSGYVSASNLLLTGGNVALNNTSNAIGTLAASGVSGLGFVNSGALTLGTVGSTNGVSATGAVSIGTQSGDLTVTQNIATTSTTATALTLNAGIATAAGTATGGNIVVSGSPTVSVGTGGTATLYTGSVSGSTGLAALVSSGNFRYGSDETTTNYTQALSTGLNAIYREQPTVTVSIDNQTMTYAGTVPTWTFSLVSGGLNGDTYAQMFASNPTVTVGGSLSASNNYTAGTHTLSSASTLTSQLGYAVGSIASGTLTVNQKALTYTGTPVSRDYDGTRNATLTNSASGIVTGSNTVQDAVTVGASGGLFDTKDVGTGKTVTVSVIALSGADAANYSIAPTATLSSGVITPKTLTVTGLTASDKTYDGTTAVTIGNWGSLSGLVGNETLTFNHGTAAFSDANAGTAKTVTASGYSMANGTNGGLVSNYQFSGVATTTATIHKAVLTVIANDDAKFVTPGADPSHNAAGYNGVSYTGFVNGETASVLGGSVLVSRSNVGTTSANTYPGVLVADTSALTATNYSFTTQNGTYTIVPSNQLLIRVTNTNNTYGTAATYASGSWATSNVVAQYYNGSSVVTLASPVNNGNGSYTVNDGAGATATFTLTPGSNTASSAGWTRVGAYQLGATVTASTNSANYSNNFVVVGAQTVGQAAVTASASGGVSKVYDGSTAMNQVSLALSGVFTGDTVAVSGTGLFSSRNAGTGLSYTIGNLALTGTDAANYYLSGGGSFSGSNGAITPRTLTVSAVSDSKAYDGTTASSQTPTYTGLVSGDALSGLVQAFDSSAVGVRNLQVASGYLVADGNNGANYQVVLVAATGAITGNVQVSPSPSVLPTVLLPVPPAQVVLPSSSDAPPVLTFQTADGGTTDGVMTDGGMVNGFSAAGMGGDGVPMADGAQAGGMVSDGTQAADGNGGSAASASSAVVREALAEGTAHAVAVIVRHGKQASVENVFDVSEDAQEISVKPHAAPLAVKVSQPGRTKEKFFFTMPGIARAVLKFEAVLTDASVVVRIRSKDGRHVSEQRREQMVRTALEAARGQFKTPLSSIKTVFLDLLH